MLRKLEVLMYSGRDGRSVFDVERLLHRDTREITVSVVSEKIPLDQYLERGLARALGDGVDLDAPFVAPRRRRDLQVACDYETSARAGAAGTFQVIALTEDGSDVTDLVDLGVHFHELDELRRHLEARTGDEILLEESDGSSFDLGNHEDARELGRLLHDEDEADEDGFIPGAGSDRYGGFPGDGLS